MKCCRRGKSHLYAMFLESGNKFMFDSKHRIKQLNDRALDPELSVMDLGVLDVFKCIMKSPFSLHAEFLEYARLEGWLTIIWEETNPEIKVYDRLLDISTLSKELCNICLISF